MNQKKQCQNYRYSNHGQRSIASTIKTFNGSLKGTEPHHAFYRARSDLQDYIVTSQPYPFGPPSPEFQKKRTENLTETSLPFISVVQDNEPEYIKSILKSPGDSKGRSDKKVQFTSTPNVEIYSVYSPSPISSPLPEKYTRLSHNNNNINTKYRLRLSSINNIEIGNNNVSNSVMFNSQLHKSKQELGLGLNVRGRNPLTSSYTELKLPIFIPVTNNHSNEYQQSIRPVYNKKSLFKQQTKPTLITQHSSLVNLETGSTKKLMHFNNWQSNKMYWYGWS